MLVNNRPELNIAHAIQTTTPTTFASMTIYISYQATLTERCTQCHD
jgi:hypothetical protein